MTILHQHFNSFLGYPNLWETFCELHFLFFIKAYFSFQSKSTNKEDVWNMARLIFDSICFIYFVFYPVVAYFKDAKGMSKATVFNTAGLTYLQDFANTPT